MAAKLKNEELGRLSAEAFRAAGKHPFIIVLDNVRSLHNVGSVFRTADSFLIHSVVLCGVTGTPPNKEIEKTALGATSTVSWKYFANTKEAVEELRSGGWKIYAAEQSSDSIKLDRFEFSDEKTALVLGNEVYGVDESVLEYCDGVIEIPQAGSKHSLNISVAAGILTWEFFRQRKN